MTIRRPHGEDGSPPLWDLLASHGIPSDGDGMVHRFSGGNPVVEMEGKGQGGVVGYGKLHGNDRWNPCFHQSLRDTRERVGGIAARTLAGVEHDQVQPRL